MTKALADLRDDPQALYRAARHDMWRFMTAIAVCGLLVGMLVGAILAGWRP